MSKKIYVDGYPSYYEYVMGTDMEPLLSVSGADVVVNPVGASYIHKHIIINLPTKLTEDEIVRLSKFNTIESRYPIPETRLDPYERVPHPSPSKDYSKLILTEELLNTSDTLEISGSNFLIGVCECVNGESTLIGKKISDTRIEDI